MATLLYSPGVRVLIETSRIGIIDVSEDLRNGSLRLAENQPSQFSFVLVNHRRKYDGIFTPNDLITVQMKRVRWLPVFAGYLDQVPYFSVYPRSVQLQATDTLKRLKYRLWDPGAPESVALLNQASPTGGRDQTDGGMRDKIIALLTDVGDWPQRTIHIGRLPEKWMKRMEKLAAKMADETAIDPMLLGSGPVIAGTNGASAGSTTAETPTTFLLSQSVFAGATATGATNTASGMGVLPAMTGTALTFGGEGAEKWAGMELTKERLNAPQDPWYCQMRWPYGKAPGLANDHLTAKEYAEAKKWWANRKILVVNQKNQRAVVLRAADWGPENRSKDIGMSPHALRTVLGADGTTPLDIRFAPADADLGPTVARGKTTAVSGNSAPPTTTPAKTLGSAGTGTGERLTSDENLKPVARAARAFIKANWNVPWGVGGYAPRTESGPLPVANDHTRGLALDVVVCKGGTEAEGADAALGDAVAGWFAANAAHFGTRYIVWRNRINHGSGWLPYGDPTSKDHTAQHRDHVHISFWEVNPYQAEEVSTEMPYTETGIVQDPEAVV